MKKNIIKIPFIISKFLLFLIIAKFSYAKDMSFIIEKDFENDKLSIDKAYILDGSQNEDRK